MKKQKISETAAWTITRRDFLEASVCATAGFVLKSSSTYANDIRQENITLRFGIVTDVHYADTDASEIIPGVRLYHRESLTKMRECINIMNKEHVDFLIELGDFVGPGTPDPEKNSLKNLKMIEEVFQEFDGRRYHVVGNHDFDSLSKEQFLDYVENSRVIEKSAYYSFDLKNLHFIVLDASYKKDGSEYDHGNYDRNDRNDSRIPNAELDWLKKDLTAASSPVIVFIHYPLDVDAVVSNADQVRQILQASQKVLAVFQGHVHLGNYSFLGGIHYYTLRAMAEGVGIEGNSYGIVEVQNNHSLIVIGYRRAETRRMTRN